MNIRIKTTQTDMSEALEAYINKKVGRLERKLDSVETVDVQLKEETKPSATSKTVVISLTLMGTAIRVEKKCKAYNEGVDKCLDVVKEQIEKVKQKTKEKA